MKDAVKHKQSRKELLKQEDAFLHAAHESAIWVKHHRTIVIGGSAALVAAILGVWGAVEYTNAQSLKASELYLAAVEINEAKITADNKDAAPEADANEPKKPSFATEADRNKAAREAFQKVVDETPRTGVAKLARFYVADLDSKMGEHDKALTGFKSLTDSLDSSHNLYFLAVERLAYLQEQKGEVDAALASWRRLSEMSGKQKFYVDHALYEMARLQAARGEKDKARETLAQLEKDFAQTSLRSQVEELYAQVGRPAPTAKPEDAPAQKATP